MPCLAAGSAFAGRFLLLGGFFAMHPSCRAVPSLCVVFSEIFTALFSEIIAEEREMFNQGI